MSKKKDTFIQTQRKLKNLESSLKSLEQLKQHLELATNAVNTLQTYCIQRQDIIRKKCAHKHNDGTSALEHGMFGSTCEICGWDDY